MKTLKSTSKARERYIPLLATFALAVYLGVGWYLITAENETHSSSGFGVASGQYIDDSRQHENLDLRIVQEVSYPSTPLSKIQVLESENGIEKSLIQFSVKVDKLEEFGLMYLPAGEPPQGGFPVIILLHAYQHPDEYTTTGSYETDMAHYAQNGFAVIKPDFRGQGLSRSVGQPEGANYAMAYNSDTMSLISAVKQTPYLKPTAINVWGHSMGAYIGLRASVLSDDIKSAILLAGPVASFSSTFDRYHAPSDIGNPVAGQIKDRMLLKYGTPSANPNFWYNASPINFVNQREVYYQIHVGALDFVVPPQFSAELDLKLSSLGRDHGFYQYPTGDHDLLGDRLNIWKRSLEVLVR